MGIVGLGAISTRFATVLQGVEGVELAAVAARDQVHAQGFARQFKAKKTFDNYRDLIKDEEVAAVYIGLTNQWHFELSKLCLENHKAVLCEKPMVTSQKEAEELVSLAAKNRTLLMEALWTRCLPAFQKAKEWIKLGRIGQVKLISANFCFKTDFDPKSRLFDPALAGGSLYDVGVYPIHLATGIMGKYPEVITGSAKILPSGVDESASIHLQFPNGTQADLTCGFTVDSMGAASIFGSQGHLVLDNCYGPQRCELFNEENQKIDLFSEPVPDGFIYEIRHFLNLFRIGKLESDLIPWKDSIACAKIIDELRNQWGLT